MMPKIAEQTFRALKEAGADRLSPQDGAATLVAFAAVCVGAAAQTFLALQQGDIAFTSDIPSLIAPMHRAGSAHAIFVATDQRSSHLPDIPTAREAGLGDYQAYSWYGIYGPAGTPRPIVDRLAAAIDQALGDPAIHQRLEDMGTPAMRGWTPERFARYLRTEIDLWVPLVRASGARAD